VCLLHFNICKEIGAKLDIEHWYKRVIRSVDTSPEGKVTIWWNPHVQTNRTVVSNKLDIVIRDDKKGTCVLIDAAISGDRNLIKREAEEVLKYKDLAKKKTTYVECKKKVIPLIIQAAGIISKSFRKYLSDTPGKNQI
jgi:hypothetical protein